MVLGNSMLIPVLPQMKSALNISQFKVSLVITLFSVPAGLVIPLAGFLSDRINRKIIIVPSLLLYGLGGVVALIGILILNNSFMVIMAGRIMQGIGAAGTAPIAMALASDIFVSGERSKALGLMEASNAFGKVVSPILGSLVGLMAWYATFFVFPALCIPIALAVWFLVKDPSTNKKGQSVQEYLQSLKKIFKGKGFHLLSAFFAGSVALFTLFGTLFYLSDYLERKYGLEGVMKGLVLAIPVLAICSTSIITGIVTQRKSNNYKLLVVVGLVLLGISNFLIPFFIENTYIFIGALVFGGIGGGLVLTCLNTIITSTVNMEERGMITSLYGAVRFFGVAIGPPVFGLLMERNNLLTFGTPGSLALLAALLTFFAVKRKYYQNQAGTNEAQRKKETFSWKKWLLDTITLKNTAGRWVIKPALKRYKTKKINELNEMQSREWAGTNNEDIPTAEYAGAKSEK
ncbi:MAG: MFS transporter [Clostridia bacterium]|nr:MFS transporter [Clostridia bacterium]